MAAGPPRPIRFGLYQLDPASGELTKNGRTIRLQPQPTQVLLTLLSRPGDVVTRSELQSLIWGKETFVDFDHGLNKAINKLREVLNDSADTPRFIETLPRRGYRFIGAVTLQPSPELKGPLLVIAPDGHPPTAAGDADASSAARGKGRTRTLHPGLWTLAAALLLFLSAAAAWLHFATRLTLTGSRQLTNDGRPKLGRVVTDGRRVYFLEAARDNASGPISPAYVSIAGGATVLIPSQIPAHIKMLNDVSPDGNELLIGTDDPGRSSGPNPRRFWIVSTSDGAARPLGDLHGYEATWSPNGQRILFTNYDAILTANNAGTDVRKLIPADYPSEARWWPDGSHIRFTQSETVWDMLPDGTHLARVTSDQVPYCMCSSWTSDGRFFLYERDGRLWSLRTFPRLVPIAPRPAQLTFESLHLGTPAPDPTRPVVYALTSHPRGELVRYDRGRGVFVPYVPAISGNYVEFSPDGQFIAYVSYPDGGLWRSRIDGSDRIHLVSEYWILSPAWSPDGKRIAYSAWGSAGIRKIYVVPSTGGNIAALQHGTDPEADPSWSPDGTKMAFAPLPWNDYSPGGPKGRISIIDLKTKQVTRLPGSVRAYSPRWSPDGQYIAAIELTGGVMLFRFSDSSWRQIADSGGFPHWSRDSKHVYVDAKDSIWKLGLDGSRHLVANMRDMRRVRDLDYWHGLTPDESVMALKDAGIQEIVALSFTERLP